MLGDSTFDACPISDELLGRIYRGGPEAVDSAISNLPEMARARLAAFCYARTHLQEIGLSIAATCDERSLTEAAGRAGEALYARSRKRVAAVAPSPTPNKRTISLAKLAPIRTWTVIQGGLADIDPEPAGLAGRSMQRDGRSRPCRGFRRRPGAGRPGLAIERDGTGDITGLKRAEVLGVAKRHEFPARAWMIEPDRMTHLMRDRVTNVVNIEVAIETDFPELGRVEANQRFLDAPNLSRTSR